MTGRRLQAVGAALLVLGLAAHTFGWGWVGWLPREALAAGEAFLRALREDPLTYGLIAAGLGLIVAARFVRR
jgi:hypothetical protein